MPICVSFYTSFGPSWRIFVNVFQTVLVSLCASVCLEKAPVFDFKIVKIRYCAKVVGHLVLMSSKHFHTFRKREEKYVV